jgi:hypothetical protein
MEASVWVRGDDEGYIGEFEEGIALRLSRRESNGAHLRGILQA